VVVVVNVFEDDDDDVLLLLGMVVVVVVLGIVGMTMKWKRGVGVDTTTSVEDDEVVCIFCFALVDLVVLFWQRKK